MAKRAATEARGRRRLSPAPDDQQNALQILNDLARRNRAQSTGPFSLAGCDIQPPAPIPTDELCKYLIQAREHRLCELINFAEDRLRPQRSAAQGNGIYQRELLELRRRPVREQLVEWLNSDYRHLEARRRLLEDEARPKTRRQRFKEYAQTMRAEHDASMARVTTEETLAAELRDLAGYALCVHDPRYMAWIDDWVDRWALAAAGDEEARSKIEQQRGWRAKAGRKTAKRRHEDHEKFKVKPYREEYRKRFAASEKSADIIADMARKYDPDGWAKNPKWAKKRMRDMIKPRQHQGKT